MPGSPQDPDAEGWLAAGSLSAELAVVETTASATERKLTRYRDDYEAERIASDTYQEAKGRLEEQLLKVRGRIAQLQLELAGHDLAAMPTEADRKALHATLVERVRTGPTDALGVARKFRAVFLLTLW